MRGRGRASYNPFVPACASRKRGSRTTNRSVCDFALDPRFHGDERNLFGHAACAASKRAENAGIRGLPRQPVEVPRSRKPAFGRRRLAKMGRGAASGSRLRRHAGAMAAATSGFALAICRHVHALQSRKQWRVAQAPRHLRRTVRRRIRQIGKSTEGGEAEGGNENSTHLTQLPTYW